MPSNQFLIGWLVEEVEWVAGDMEVGVAIKWRFGICAVLPIMYIYCQFIVDNSLLKYIFSIQLDSTVIWFYYDYGM